VADAAPDFVKRVTAMMMAGKGDLLPVSAFPIDGTWPLRHGALGEAQHRARHPRLGREDLHQCNQCALACPHAAIRAKIYEPDGHLQKAPGTFKYVDFKVQRADRLQVHHPGGTRGLHGVQRLCGGLPGQGQDQPRGTRRWT